MLILRQGRVLGVDPLPPHRPGLLGLLAAKGFSVSPSSSSSEVSKTLPLTLGRYPRKKALAERQGHQCRHPGHHR